MNTRSRLIHAGRENGWAVHPGGWQRFAGGLKFIKKTKRAYREIRVDMDHMGRVGTARDDITDGTDNGPVTNLWQMTGTGSDKAQQVIKRLITEIEMES